MFTGIIQEIGQVLNVESKGGKEFTVSCSQTVDQLKIGDSVAVNGACQTATHISSNSFSFYSSTETLSLTNLDQLKKGDRVNLERPLTVNTLLDGHLVQGHVDGTGKIDKIEKHPNEYHISINCSDDLLRYMIQKGSVAVDGVSLTINKLYDNGFSLTLIPTTVEKTLFQYNKPGDIVNLEVDLFAKYVERFMTLKTKSPLTKDFLSEHGFV